MWISKQLAEDSGETELHTGKSTLNSNGRVEVVSSSVNRNVDMYAPYGYSFSLPAGNNVLLAKGDGEQIGIGVSVDGDELETGEIKITSFSGGYIHIRQDGSVVINGLIINRNGVIE